jgi:membrane-associated phospholipid phosphatase
MPVLALLLVAVVVGSLAGIGVWRFPALVGPGAAPALDTAEDVGARVRRHPRLRGFVRARFEPSVATGLALTLALLLAIGGGVLIGLLAYLVRTNAHLVGIDNGAAKWGNRHATTASRHALDAITQLGSVYVVVGLCVVLAVAETIRERSVWVVPFVIAVMGGEEILTASVKSLVDRARPTFNPAAASLGPSFPSGHSATAAAFYATAALLVGRGRSRPTRALLAGLAVGIAVAVAASRVLLDVHWVTDVIAGLALGWGWFAVCGLAFGGRILRFGAAAEAAAQAAEIPRASVRRSRSRS